jgi:hypothetical protein
LVRLAEILKEERTVRILRGEFMNSRESLDLTEKKGRYASTPTGFKSQEGQDRGSESQGPSDLLVVSHIGVS